MRAQQMEEKLREVQVFMKDELLSIVGVDGYTARAYQKFIKEIDEVLDRSPAGGKVDTRM